MFYNNDEFIISSNEHIRVSSYETLLNGKKDGTAFESAYVSMGLCNKLPSALCIYRRSEVLGLYKEWKRKQRSALEGDLSPRISHAIVQRLKFVEAILAIVAW